MDERSLIGQEKYGATMMEEIQGQKKDLNRFIVDVQEELMDAILYIQAAKDELAEAKDKVYGESINGLPYYVSDIAS